MCLPNVSKGTRTVVQDTQRELIQIPDTAQAPGCLSIQHLDDVGQIFVKVGVDKTDVVNDEDFHFLIQPGGLIDEDNIPTGSVLIISDQAAGVQVAWNARYKINAGPGSNVS
jgi:hypothetical protein